VLFVTTQPAVSATGNSQGIDAAMTAGNAAAVPATRLTNAATSL
jgi:hypothetical protein